MKKTILLFILLLTCLFALNAQDEIFLKTGKIIKCRIDSLNSKKLYFIDKKLVSQYIDINLVSSYIWDGETNKGLNSKKQESVRIIKTDSLKNEKIVKN